MIAGPGDPIDRICFLDGGIASYAMTAADGARTGIGMVGYEGLVEWPALLGSGTSP